MLALLQDWQAAHGDPPLWHALLRIWGPVVLLLISVPVLVRSLLHARRYRVDAVLGERQREVVHAALREAERRTVGEIVPVVVARSDAHPGAHWLAALTSGLVLTALLMPWLPWTLPPALVLCQLAFGLAGYLASRGLPSFQRLFVRDRRAREVADEQAFQEFHAHGLHKTTGATGVLIFVSLFEHRVVVLADEGIAAHVEPGVWDGIDAAVIAHIARGELDKGLVEGITRAGAVLAEHAPWLEGDRNELPDRLIVRGC